LELWAQSVASGIPDELFWRLTPVEAGALINQLVELESRRERAARLRAGLIAATIMNTTPRRKGDHKVYQPTDFWKDRKVSNVEIVAPAVMARRLAAWGDAIRRRNALMRKATG
jgi:hypothetical protein